jgi:hypothetical protein
MKAKFALLLLPAFGAACFAQEDSAPRNELAFGLCGIPALSRSDSPSLDARSGVAFRVNYGRRFFRNNKVALYGEINFLASPLRDVSTLVTTATRDFSSLYLTPGIRVKFLPALMVSPYVLVSGGYADYDQSTTLINGQPNLASRELARGVFDFGTGLDVRIWRLLALRGEACDYYTGSPGYNVTTISGGHQNIVATGGFVPRWH